MINSSKCPTWKNVNMVLSVILPSWMQWRISSDSKPKAREMLRTGILGKGRADKRKKGNPGKRNFQVSTGDKFHLYVLQGVPMRTVKTLRCSLLCPWSGPQIRKSCFWSWTSTPSLMLRSIRVISKGASISGTLMETVLKLQAIKSLNSNLIKHNRWS